MQLRFSVMARDRKFSKAMRRVRERLQPLLNEFELVEMTDPIHEAILIGITDDQPSGFFEEVPNNDGFFQIMAGVEFSGSEVELNESVFEILRKAAMACPFSRPDRAAFDSLFERMRPTVVN